MISNKRHSTTLVCSNDRSNVLKYIRRNGQIVVVAALLPKISKERRKNIPTIDREILRYVANNL